jgi:hypothetical protein
VKKKLMMIKITREEQQKIHYVLETVTERKELMTHSKVTKKKEEKLFFVCSVQLWKKRE